VEDARDVTQTVFVTAFQKLDQFHSGHSFTAWLFAIARNRSTDWLRRRRDAEPVGEDMLVDETSPAEAAGAADDAATLWRLAREVLSPGHFDTVWLYYQEGLNLAEVARVTRQTIVGVKVRLFRARQRLGEALKRRGWIEGAGRNEVRGASDIVNFQPRSVL
jgi:RNA polymerase sigma-70 factor (ECF subfamily)